MMHRSNDELVKTGVIKLLKIKDSDIRITTLMQGWEAVDHGIHIGGAFSVTVPMVSLFYGGFMNLDIQEPAKIGQDMFVLSKGHAVATMASVYADLGYFDSKLLKNSRSMESILNGHPGPLLPGVHIATGPLGQGLAAAQGFAMAGKSEPEFNVFCITGDGELQEGVVWEAIMHAPQRRLDNLFVIVDKNEGQLDNHSQLIFPMDNLPGQIESFGWDVINVDGTSYSEILAALEYCTGRPRDGRPTAIVCNGKKGFGSFSQELNKHKVTLSKDLYEQELALQEDRRRERNDDFIRFLEVLKGSDKNEVIRELQKRAETMRLSIVDSSKAVASSPGETRKGRVQKRDKKVSFNPDELPVYEADAEAGANEVVSDCMKIFARDKKVVSVDSDLGSTSGLEKGIGAVDENRGINIGIAESNMMCVGEAFAALGYNAWVSTFCPFFDWKVLRRIAVGAQERYEAMEAPDGWLSEGHELDLTFLATASNFETKTNGATHMGNDDTVIFGGIAGLKIIDVSCPNQLVGIMKWIMEGNKGLVYLRIMRAPSGVIYPGGFKFEFGKAYRPYGTDNSKIRFVSSGRGVHEAIAAAKLVEKNGETAAVYDMPSFDEEVMTKILGTDGITVIAEQNNGFIWNRLGQLVLSKGGKVDLSSCLALNVNKSDGSYRYIHSATYGQLLERFGLNPEKLAQQAMEFGKNG